MARHQHSTDDPSGEIRTEPPEPPKPPTEEDAAYVATAVARSRILALLTAILTPLLLAYLIVEAHNWPMVFVVIWVALLGASILASDSAAARHGTNDNRAGRASFYLRLNYDRHRQFDKDAQTIDTKHRALADRIADRVNDVLVAARTQALTDHEEARERTVAECQAIADQVHQAIREFQAFVYTAGVVGGVTTVSPEARAALNGAAGTSKARLNGTRARVSSPIVPPSGENPPS